MALCIAYTVCGENTKPAVSLKMKLHGRTQLPFVAYVCKNFGHMEVKQKPRGLYWLIFFISTAALLLAIWSHWPWLTLIIPFVATSFVLALDII